MECGGKYCSATIGENVVSRLERQRTHIAIRVYTRCVIAALVHAPAYTRIVFLMHDSRRTWSLCANKRR